MLACVIMLSVFLVFACLAAPVVAAVSCHTKEYATRDGQCCPMCQEGTVVQRDCTAFSGTQCRSCEVRTYMNHLNGLSNCFPCTTCDTGHGLFVKRNCTPKTDTVCDVLNGYHCKDLIESNGCSLAEKHSQCEAGQRIKQHGTSRSDTVCEDCQPGFFSKDGVNCTAWKTCLNRQIKVRGSSTSDVVCGRTSSQHYFVFLPFLLCSVAFTSLVTDFSWEGQKTQHRQMNSARPLLPVCSVLRLRVCVCSPTLFSTRLSWKKKEIHKNPQLASSLAVYQNAHFSHRLYQFGVIIPR